MGYRLYHGRGGGLTGRREPVRALGVRLVGTVQHVRPAHHVRVAPRTRPDRTERFVERRSPDDRPLRLPTAAAVPAPSPRPLRLVRRVPRARGAAQMVGPPRSRWAFPFPPSYSPSSCRFLA